MGALIDIACRVRSVMADVTLVASVINFEEKVGKEPYTFQITAILMP